MKRPIIGVIVGAKKWWMHVFVCVCCLLSIAPVATAHGTDFSRKGGSLRAQNAHAAMPDSQFAIGDFDGDRQPDLANVEIGHFSPLQSRYWVSLQLSKGRQQTLGVTAPAGGLVLLARDVNGDRALDLVLVTTWRHDLVAVLLNDGEGNFSAADPRQFPIEGVSSTTQMRTVPRLREGRTALSFPYSALAEPGRNIPAAPELEQADAAVPGFAAKLVRSSFSSRAPPALVLHV